MKGDIIIRKFVATPSSTSDYLNWPVDVEVQQLIDFN